MTKTQKADGEDQLAADLHLINLLKDNPEIFNKHPEIMAKMIIPHQTGSAISLIERQVSVLREQLQLQEDRMCEIMGIAHDNEHLSKVRHQLAINLLQAQGLDEKVSFVLELFRNELSADYVVIKLFSDDEQQIKQSTNLFFDKNDSRLKAFKTLLQYKNTVCGKSTDAQKEYLFDKQAKAIKSVAIIPLISGSNLGLVGLGSNTKERYKSNMGTEFLAQVGEMISATLVGHLHNK